VQHVWYSVKKCHALGLPIDVTSRKPKNSGRKNVEVGLSYVTNIPLQWTTIHSLVVAIGVKRSTLHMWFKDGKLRRHSNPT
jgi:hypothetical protein